MGSGPWGERTCRPFSRVSPARSRSSAPRRLTRRAHRITVPRSTSTRRVWWSGRSSFPERWSGTSSSHDGGRGTRDEGRVESRQHPSPVPRPAPDRFLLMSNLLASEPSAYLKSAAGRGDRKSTRLNSSHGYISYAVFCLKKKRGREELMLVLC